MKMTYREAIKILMLSPVYFSKYNTLSDRLKMVRDYCRDFNAPR